MKPVERIPVVGLPCARSPIILRRDGKIQPRQHHLVNLVRVIVHRPWLPILVPKTSLPNRAYCQSRFAAAPPRGDPSIRVEDGQQGWIGLIKRRLWKLT